jgi:hypothetical protein
MPEVRGSLDAITVTTTGPAAATMPAGPPVLPAGHPDAGTGMIPGHPAKMQQSKGGAFRVNVTQGTPGAAAIGKDRAKVELFAKGAVIKTYDMNLDEKGCLEIHEIPLETAFQPVVSVWHGGVEQQMVGVAMHRYQPAVEMDMKVYEVTTEKPAWTIGIRHIVAEPVEVDGKLILRVTEMIGGYNPLDKAWIGENGVTVSVALPAGAANVQFGPGMAEAGAKVVGGKVVRGKTMLPGSTQYVFGYDLPVVEGKAAMNLTAPADTTLFALYLPGDAKVDQMKGVEAGKAAGTHADAARQMLKAKAIKAGDEVVVALSEIKKPKPAEKPVEPMEQTTDLHLPTIPTKGK